jgi:DNA-binding protein H-NS
MTITWTEFDRLLESAEHALEKFRVLAELRNDADRAEFDRLGQFVLDTTGKFREMTTRYTPDIATDVLRADYLAKKVRAKSMQDWVLQHKGQIWSPNN